MENNNTTATIEEKLNLLEQNTRDEYDNYRYSFKGYKADSYEILEENAYSYHMHEEIYMAINSMIENYRDGYDIEQYNNVLNVLYSLDDPINQVYHWWMGRDDNTIDSILDCMIYNADM